MLKLQTGITTIMRVSDSIKTADGQIVPVIDGIGSLSEVVSPNGYRYRKSFWPHVFKQQYFQDAIKNRTSLGTIEHPKDDEAYLRTPYEDASHVVIDVQLRKGDPYCKFAIANNQKGNSIKALVDLNVPVGVSTRGLGETLKDDISPYIDENNYAWITWDIVNNPNFADLKMKVVSDSLRAHPIFQELVQAYSLRDSQTDSFNKEALIKETQIMRQALENVINLLGVENLFSFSQGKILNDQDTVIVNNRKVTKEDLESDYRNLQFSNCDIISFPENFTVDGTLRFENCATNLPEILNCNTLDIRNCKNITKLPGSLNCKNLWAQGSGITELPSFLHCDLVNIVNTQINIIPETNIIAELRAPKGILVKGLVKNLIEF